MPDFSLEQGLPVGPQIYRSLRLQIIRAQLLPGSRLSEAECAQEFDVSRQPVREAFIKLSEEGLVEVRPQRGTLVRKISIAAVLEARFVREAIEADVVKRVAELGDPGIITELRNQLRHQRAAAAAAPDSFLALDELFHRTLAEAAGIAHAWKVVEGIKAQMDRVRYLSFGHTPVPKLVIQHNHIVDAIEQGDQSIAEQTMRVHLREILSDLPAISAARPELFDDQVQQGRESIYPTQLPLHHP
ncbi:GntR family transcriptional regulator [Allopusillimonas ginsengisoli]|nr:GntR family transcriptional regulator [Allopusillimonas ginsengisoli]